MDYPVKLAVPYKSQLDNALNPPGACNVTSLAMCLGFLRCDRRNLRYEQFEDELYAHMQSNQLSRHSPQDLALVARDYGARDRFTYNATFDAVKEHLRGGNPCITHGYFTSFGHIIVLVGYDADGFIVHDPYGEWFKGGYDTSASGAYLHYSYELIQRTCAHDGQFWVHFVS